MKREIKFRGKKRTNGQWVYGSLVSSQDLNAAIYFQTGNGSVKTMDWVYVQPETIGQFTGLFDKNGREIYEGDIVKWSYDGLCYVVAFRRGMFFASAHELNEDVYGGYPLWMICDDNDLCEIIGNIHDNPSMLKNS